MTTKKSLNDEFEQIMFPDNLLAVTQTANGNSITEYSNVYAAFYINVNNASKLFSEGGEDSEHIGRRRESERGGLLYNADDERLNITTDNLAKRQLSVNTAGALFGSALGLGGGSFVAGALQSATAEVLADYSATASREQKTLKSVIALPMPNQLTMSYDVTWNDTTTDKYQKIVKLGDIGLEAVKGLFNDFANSNSLNENFESAKTTLSNSFVNSQATVSSFALDTSPTQALSLLTGVASNPLAEQHFTGVDHRTFTLDYQFFPRSESEMKTMHRIVKLFKYHMMPEYKDENRFLFLYPSEFDVVYYVIDENGDRENEYIHKHTSCVLTQVIVNYAPSTVFNTFQDGSGSPTQINLTLTFKELGIMTKELIEKGY